MNKIGIGIVDDKGDISATHHRKEIFNVAHISGPFVNAKPSIDSLQIKGSNFVAFCVYQIIKLTYIHGSFINEICT